MDHIGTIPSELWREKTMFQSSSSISTFLSSIISSLIKENVALPITQDCHLALAIRIILLSRELGRPTRLDISQSISFTLEKGPNALRFVHFYVILQMMKQVFYFLLWLPKRRKAWKESTRKLNFMEASWRHKVCQKGLRRSSTSVSLPFRTIRTQTVHTQSSTFYLVQFFLYPIHLGLVENAVYW